MRIFSKLIDLTGEKFGRLIVIKRAKDHIQPNGSIKVCWVCECDCGNKNVIVKGFMLKSGKTKSCGCLSKELTYKRSKRYNRYDLSGNYGIGYTTKGETFYFDLEDHNLIKDYCWNIDIHGYVVAKNITGKKLIRQHRLVMLNKIDDEDLIDHISHKKIDNRKINLRIADHSTNGVNKPLVKTNTSGVTGVYWSEQREKWVAQITNNYRCINLGGFSNFNDAVKARKQAEEKYFGEYSYDNSQMYSQVNVLN